MLSKIKGKKTDETSKTKTKIEEPLKMKRSSKKSGNFQTVWEAQFENKAERIAMVSYDGKIVIGSFFCL